VLQALGVDLDVPEAQTCCGQPVHNSGGEREARRVARTTLAAFAGSEVVVTPSGSCAAMVRHGWPELFAGRPEEAEARRLAANTWELSQFLISVLGVDRLPVRFEARATWHPSCHLERWLGGSGASLTVLGMVEGLELVPLPGARDCCGFGGTFSVKMPATSAAMTEEKCDRVLSTGAEVLVAADMGCLRTIRRRLAQRGAEVRTLHTAELLAEGWQGRV